MGKLEGSPKFTSVLHEVIRNQTICQTEAIIILFQLKHAHITYHSLCLLDQRSDDDFFSLEYYLALGCSLSRLPGKAGQFEG